MNSYPNVYYCYGFIYSCGISFSMGDPGSLLLSSLLKFPLLELLLLIEKGVNLYGSVSSLSSFYYFRGLFLQCI